MPQAKGSTGMSVEERVLQSKASDLLDRVVSFEIWTTEARKPRALVLGDPAQSRINSLIENYTPPTLPELYAFCLKAEVQRSRDSEISATMIRRETRPADPDAELDPMATAYTDDLIMRVGAFGILAATAGRNKFSPKPRMILEGDPFQRLLNLVSDNYSAPSLPELYALYRKARYKGDMASMTCSTRGASMFYEIYLETFMKNIEIRNGRVLYTSACSGSPQFEFDFRENAG